METTERLEADRTRAEQELAEQTAAVEQEKSAALRVSARDQEELKKLRAERAGLRADAEADLLADYDRIAKARKTGLAEVREQECQGCHVRLRPAQWQHLREGALMHCESCGRLLYYDEGGDQKLAAKAAGQWDLP
jgi:predicted  nucleic acid-binding Zn-ribbon protein